MAEICVIGAGPAGSTFATRMAQMGHAVTLVERARFPRRRLGESLSPGVLPLLEPSGARAAIENAGFPRVRRVHVRWDGPAAVREDPGAQGVLADRGVFDALLLEHARACGVRVLQPARMVQASRAADGWALDVSTESGGVRLTADFVGDATGRSARMRSARSRTGPRTVALHAYWRGAVAGDPRIEAGSDAWYWGVPLPDGSYNALVFIDSARFQGAGPASLESRYLGLMTRSGIPIAGAKIEGLVQSSDASAWLEQDCVSSSRISIGDAAISIDSISSSGVQKAIQSAISGAVVANTMLRKPSAADAAIAFYRTSLREASERHARWAAGHYGAVASERGGQFWLDRSHGGKAEPAANADVHTLPAEPWNMRLEPSRRLEFVELPCIEGDFVSPKLALRHPGLHEPVAFLGGREIASFLRRVRAGSTFSDIVTSLSAGIPPRSAFGIARWLVEHGILVAESAEAERSL